MQLFALEDMTPSYADARWFDLYLINVTSQQNHFKHLLLEKNAYALLYFTVMKEPSFQFLSYGTRNCSPFSLTECPKNVNNFGKGYVGSEVR